jgi:hypothetical protein
MPTALEVFLGQCESEAAGCPDEEKLFIRGWWSQLDSLSQAMNVEDGVALAVSIEVPAN